MKEFYLEELKIVNQQITSLTEKMQKEFETNYFLKLKLKYIKDLNFYNEDNSIIEKLYNLNNEYSYQNNKKNTIMIKNDLIADLSIFTAMALVALPNNLAANIALFTASLAYSIDFAWDNFISVTTLSKTIETGEYGNLEKNLEKFNNKKYKLVKSERKQLIKSNNANKQSVSKETLISFLKSRYNESLKDFELDEEKLELLKDKKCALEMILCKLENTKTLTHTIK